MHKSCTILRLTLPNFKPQLTLATRKRQNSIFFKIISSNANEKAAKLFHFCSYSQRDIKPEVVVLNIEFRIMNVNQENVVILLYTQVKKLNSGRIGEL